VKIAEALREARDLISAAGGEEAGLDAEVLMMQALGWDRVRLYQESSGEIADAELALFGQLVERRAAREPLAYITGRKDFFGLEFEVSPAVLIPRPETETLVECVIEHVNKGASEQGGTTPIIPIADVGTGSGAIAVALAKSLPGVRVVATDVSRETLELARRNAERHGVAGRIDFRHGDLLAPVGGKVDVIASNLPYVTTAMLAQCPPEIRDWEPRSALDGGADGLDVIRRLFEQAPERLGAGVALFCEIGDWQGEDVGALARAAFPEARVEVRQDLAGRDRVVCEYNGD
jgi:release factor glutamine methyltransferase